MCVLFIDALHARKCWEMDKRTRPAKQRLGRGKPRFELGGRRKSEQDQRSKGEGAEGPDLNLVAEGRVNKTSERETKACKAQRGGAKERTGAMDDPRALLGKARKGRGRGPGANKKRLRDQSLRALFVGMVLCVLATLLLEGGGCDVSEGTRDQW